LERKATVHRFGEVPVVFRPGDWSSTTWAVEPALRKLHILLHSFESDTLAIGTLGYCFPDTEPVFTPAAVRCVRSASTFGVEINVPPPLDVLRMEGEVVEGEAPWAPRGGIARYLVLAAHADFLGRDTIRMLLGHEKGRLMRAFDALQARAAGRGVVTAVKAGQITIDCPPETSYREMDAQWCWVRDQASAEAGFTRAELQEFVCIMQVIDALALLA